MTTIDTQSAGPESEHMEYLGPPRETYLTEEWLERDLEAIHRPAWHLVGHADELPDPGSFLTFKLVNEEVVVVRGEDGRLHAYQNFCSHRGHRLCRAASGALRNPRTLVCPYHSWSFSTDDGTCKNATRMHETFDRAKWGLTRASVHEETGLVFVSMNPVATYDIPRGIVKGVGDYDLSRMKLAARIHHLVEANWKVSVENNSECYHCAANHPTLCTTYDPWRDYVENLNAVGNGDTVGDIAGHPVAARDLGMDVTWTLNNERVCAKHLPSTTGKVASAIEVWWEPGSVFQVMQDYAWSASFLPHSPQQTDLTMLFFVHADAVEGEDYQVDKLTQFYETTILEDIPLCEEVQRGLRNPNYVPGALNQHYQAGGIAFYELYYRKLAEHGYFL